MPEKSAKQEAVQPEKTKGDEVQFHAKQKKRRDDFQEKLEKSGLTPDLRKERDDLIALQKKEQQEFFSAETPYKKRHEENLAQYEKQRGDNKGRTGESTTSYVQRGDNKEHTGEPMAATAQRKGQAPLRQSYTPQRGRAGRDGQDASLQATVRQDAPLQSKEQVGYKSIVQELQMQTEILKTIASKEGLG